MPVKPVPLFLNPVAGRGRAGKNARSIVELLAANDVEVTVIESTGVGDLEQRVRDYAGSTGDSILVAGGDGSMHAVVAALHRRGDLAGATLALLPLGTGNDFARGTGVPLDIEDAARLVASIRAASSVRWTCHPRSAARR